MTGTKKISLSRLKKNFGKIIRSCTPPVIQKIFEPPRQPANLPSEIPTPEPDVEFLIPAVEPSSIWPEFDQVEITMLSSQIRRHLWAMPENELMVLAALAKILKPKNVFEFGTFTGASTLAMATNTPENTRIHTLDIPPQNRRSHRTGVGSDIPFDFEIGQCFKSTPWEKKIEIHTCDAKSFDAGPFRRQMDLIFVDADHTYSFVRNDTEKALEMIAPGGVILWHDYRWDDESPECAGVTRRVNEFHEEFGNCTEIQGTRFAIYQSPTAEEREVAA